MDTKETAQEKRGRLRQDESRNNPTGSLRDGFDRGTGVGNLNDAVGDMGWKGMGLLILVLFFGYIIHRLFIS